MNFQSFHFLLFLLVLVTTCGLLWRHFTARKNLLLVASYYFYMAWDWRFAGLLLGSTLLYYSAGRLLARAPGPRQRTAWLALAVTGGLGILGVFKYFGFFVASASALARLLGLQAESTTLDLLVPVGISFYTFQGLSYVIDVHRRKLEACPDLRDFALYIAFFPTVLAGPITRGGQLLPQFARQHTVQAAEVEEALGLVVRGFVKKVLFADVLAAQIVDPVFANPQAYPPWMLLLAAYGYGFQIYMDVSGYTDIARGAALLCGFRLPHNFDRPYLATTVSNFWQRWHISMSSFFRDYVFISLGGSRHGPVYVNLMLTFLAIGLWHGGGWNFLLYGALHGGMVCLERWQRLRRQAAGQPARDGAWSALWRVAFVFTFVSFTRILFRASDPAAAWHFVQAFAGSAATSAPPFPTSGLVLLVLAAAAHWGPREWAYRVVQRVRAWTVPVQAAALTGVVYVLMAVSSQRAPFVYFMF